MAILMPVLHFKKSAVPMGLYKIFSLINKQDKTNFIKQQQHE